MCSSDLADVAAIFALAAAAPGLTATVDLPAQTVTIHTSAPRVFRFEVDAAVKETLLHGRDDITETLRLEPDIARFERTHDVQLAR